jgi:CRP-like cAMP-binding protein
VEQLQAGDCFGEMCLLLGKPLAEANMVTTVETELLVITQEAIVEILHHNRQLLNVLPEQFAQYQQDYLTGTMQMPCQRGQEVEDIEIAMVNLRGKLEAVAGEEMRSVRRKSLKPVWEKSVWDNSVWDNSVWENFCDS